MSDAQPKPAFYPALTLHLRVVLDEAFTKTKAGTSPPTSTDPSDATPGSGEGKRGMPDIYAGMSDDGLSWVMNIVPRHASVELLGYRQASKFSIEIDWHDLPIDPRVIRALGVEVHLGAVTPSAFSDGMVPTFYSGTGRQSLLKTRGVDGLPNPDTLLLIGDADTIKVEDGESGSTLHFEGRDVRGILLDSPFPVNQLGAVKLDKDIVDVVKQIVSMHPFGKRMSVVGDYTDWKDGKIPSPCAPGSMTRVNQGASGTTPHNRAAGGDKLSYWDLITRYCYLVGAIPFFSGVVIHVRPARTLYDVAEGHGPSPFAGKTQRLISGQPYSWRLMVYGRDVSHNSLERKLHGKKVPVVEAYATDTSSTSRGVGRLLKARFPPDDDKSDAAEDARSTDVSANGRIANQEVIRVPVVGVKDLGILRQVAESVWHEIGHGELSGSMSTKDLASFGGDNSDPDLLRLRPGDAVEFVTDQSTAGDFANEVQTHEKTSEDEEVKAMQSRIGDPVLSKALVVAHRGALELQRRWRVSVVKYTWDRESGVGVDFDYHNFIVARYDKVASTVLTPSQEALAAPVGTGQEFTRAQQVGDEMARGLAATLKKVNAQASDLVKEANKKRKVATTPSLDDLPPPAALVLPLAGTLQEIAYPPKTKKGA